MSNPDETPLALFRAACTPERLATLVDAARVYPYDSWTSLAGLHRALIAALTAEAPPSVADLMRECHELARRVNPELPHVHPHIELACFGDSFAVRVPHWPGVGCDALAPEAALLALRDALRAELGEGER